LLDEREMVEVQGLVQKPGKILIYPSDSLDEVISQASGLGAPGEKGEQPKFVHIFSSNGSTHVVALRDYYAGLSPLDIHWRGGDRVFFQSEQPQNMEDSEYTDGSVRASIQVLGQVQKPGIYPYSDTQGFYYYFSAAGGPTELSNFRAIEVIRARDGKQTSSFYNLTDSKVPNIQADDIIIVHALEDDETVVNATSVLNSIATAILAALAF
ncbi:MAG: SLBB domain-containing protein, partial [Bdellovibrionales bacterium]|nr:SLBB domain-containing protein [Bdellovibrionales bacterium]